MLCPLWPPGFHNCQALPVQSFLKPMLSRTLRSSLPALVLPLCSGYTVTQAKPQYIGSPYSLPPVLAFHCSKKLFCACLAASAACSVIELYVVTVCCVVVCMCCPPTFAFVYTIIIRSKRLFVNRLELPIYVVNRSPVIRLTILTPRPCAALASNRSSSICSCERCACASLYSLMLFSTYSSR